MLADRINAGNLQNKGTAGKNQERQPGREKRHTQSWEPSLPPHSKATDRRPPREHTASARDF